MFTKLRNFIPLHCITKTPKKQAILMIFSTKKSDFFENSKSRKFYLKISIFKVKNSPFFTLL